MKTTKISVAKLNQVLRDASSDYPNNADPFAGLPDAPEEDLRLFLAAGLHPSDPALPADTTLADARHLAESALADARLEVAAAMATRMLFNRHQPDPVRVQELCELPMRELVERFRESELGLESSDEFVADWINGQADQLLHWESHHERLRQLPGGLAAATLCTLRQLAGAFGLLAADMLEGHFVGSDEFGSFHDRVIGLVPGNYEFTGPHPKAASPLDEPVAA